MTAYEIAKRIEDGTQFCSMTSAVLKNPLWPKLKEMGAAALPDVFRLFMERPNPHTMRMIDELSNHAVLIPEDEWGRVPRMVKRFMTWGAENGYMKEK